MKSAIYRNQPQYPQHAMPTAISANPSSSQTSESQDPWLQSALEELGDNDVADLLENSQKKGILQSIKNFATSFMMGCRYVYNLLMYKLFGSDAQIPSDTPKSKED